MPPLTHPLGWVRDIPDKRDLKLADTPEVPVDRSGTIYASLASLRSVFPPIYNQLNLGSCTGNAIAGALEYQQIVQAEGAVTPSRLFIYFGERSIEGTISIDAGAQIRDGLKVVGKLGAPPESLWPYSDSNPGPYQRQPSHAAYVAATKRRALKYYTINQDLWDLKWCITNKYPIVFGFTVYDSFYNIGSDGLMSMPNFNTESVVGGHAVLAVGYDDAKKAIEVRNSWGPNWGDHGHFWMPYDYVTDNQLCSDFWTIRRTS